MSKNFFQKLRLNVVLFFNSLFRGMRAADDIISTNSKDGTAGNGTGEERKVENDNVYAALVRGEITQEVKDLRYETYQAVKKADEYKYVGNGVAVKKDKNQIFNKAKTKVFNKEDLSVYMIQINDLIKASVSETLSAAQNGKEPEEKHRININRKWFPRFKLENYATQIVVRTKEEGGYIIDFYVPDAPRDFNPKDIYFDKDFEEIEKKLKNAKPMTKKEFREHDRKVNSLAYRIKQAEDFFKVYERGGFYFMRPGEDEALAKSYRKFLKRHFRWSKEKEAVYKQIIGEE